MRWRAVTLACATASLALAQEQPPGSTRWSNDGYVEYVVGNAPIQVTAGHAAITRQRRQARCPPPPYGRVHQTANTPTASDAVDERLGGLLRSYSRST